MNEDELKVLFRANELEERKHRRARLRQCLINEGMLADEPMSPEDQDAHNKAMIQIAYQERYYNEELERLHFGYWHRLWRALINAR